MFHTKIIFYLWHERTPTITRTTVGSLLSLGTNLWPLDVNMSERSKLTLTSGLTILIGTLLTVHHIEEGVLEQRRWPWPLRSPPPSYGQLKVRGHLEVMVHTDGSDHVCEADRPDQLDHGNIIHCHWVQSKLRMSDHPGNKKSER